MRLYLARHGEAEHQTARVLGGRGPYPLTPRGREQAAALSRRVAGLPLCAVHASPTVRARETAEIAHAGRPIPLTFREGLVEQDWGDLTGLPIAEVEARCPGLFEHWEPGPGGGEGQLDVFCRVAAEVSAIVAAHAPEDEVLIVSHGGAIHMAVKHLLGLQPTAPLGFLPDPASLCAFELQSGRTRILYLNDVAHLVGLAARC